MIERICREVQFVKFEMVRYGTKQGLERNDNVINACRWLYSPPSFPPLKLLSGVLVGLVSSSPSPFPR